jgi:hypothetical protein
MDYRASTCLWRSPGTVVAYCFWSTSEICQAQPHAAETPATRAPRGVGQFVSACGARAPPVADIGDRPLALERRA